MSDLQLFYLIFQYSLFGILFLGAAYLFVLTLLRRDFEIIVRRPFIFIVELILVSIIPAVPLLFFAVSRKISLSEAMTWFIALAVKFAIFHVLLQTSGMYTMWFGHV